MERAAPLLGLLLVLACQGPSLVPDTGPSRADRLPAFPGRPDAFRQVTDLLFVARRDLDAWHAGRVLTGSGLRSKEGVPPRGLAAEAGFELRTAHVRLRTNLPWKKAVEVAGLAERHVRLLMEELGSDLDLVFPGAALSVVVYATRDDYRAALALAIPGQHGWSAWYDDRSRVVHACVEPARRGALPFRADLRHEMTHQILDGSTPRAGRGRMPEGHGFWLWEGIAVWSETLGDGAGQDTRAPRRARFLKRADRRELTLLSRLARLSQSEFQGNHYDQCGMLLDHLMTGGVPGGRQAVLSTLADALHDRTEGDPFPQRLGLPYTTLERQWLNTVLRER